MVSTALTSLPTDERTVMNLVPQGTRFIPNL